MLQQKDTLWKNLSAELFTAEAVLVPVKTLAFSIQFIQ